MDKCNCKENNMETGKILHHFSGGNMPVSIVIFGASGDLTKRKLMPALFNLFRDRMLPEHINITGFARSVKSDEEFRREIEEMAKTILAEEFDEELWKKYREKIHYHPGNFDTPSDYSSLKEFLEEKGMNWNKIYYLACDPKFFYPVVENLSFCGLISDGYSNIWTRVVIEKPFGHNIKSATELNRKLARYISEDQIYRIDHYLGKETVQNILSFRFGNSIFEPIFNSKYIDHVQITVAETLGMEGRRGGYYDKHGAIRDIIQNHGMQLLALVALEPPHSFEAKALRDEKVKLFKSIRPFTECCVKNMVIRGQYEGGIINGETVKSYLEETGVAPDSHTETYVAMQLHIDNWRWSGVPFYMRTGKRLKRRLTEIAVQFKKPPLNFFRTVECEGDVCDIIRAEPNVIVFRVQPDEEISLVFSAKRPGVDFLLQPVKMDFGYKSSFGKRLPEAYERLLLDVIRGDATLFPRFDEIEATWNIVEPIINLWETKNEPPVVKYMPGTDGPGEHLFDCCEGNWRKL